MVIKKIIASLLAASVLFTLAGCGTDTETLKKGEAEQSGIDIFVKPEGNSNLAGDAMPFYDETTGIMNVFYLYDDPTGVSSHHWNLTQTKDFLHWTEHEEVLPVASGPEANRDPEQALATGSVIRDQDGVYHAFYTGFNYDRDIGLIKPEELPFTEKIFHATSSDLKTWKKYPELAFYGGYRDFRDPTIVWMPDIGERGEYWLLVTTRGQVDGREQSVIRRYRSEDLWHWGEHGAEVPELSDSDIFYTNDNAYNMECTSLLNWKGYWYLMFSAQTDIPKNVTEYRYMKDTGLTGDALDAQLSDPANWSKAEIPSVNGTGWYAAKFDTFKDDRLIGIGWTISKQGFVDEGVWKWGGSLTPLEMNQREDGSLYATPVREADEFLSREVRYERAVSNAGVTFGEDTIAFEGNGNRQLFLYEPLSSNITKWEFTITPKTPSAELNIVFGAVDKNVNEKFPLVFDFESGTVTSYCKGVTTEDGTEVPDMSGPDEVIAQVGFLKRESYDCTVLIDGNVMTLFIDGTSAFSMTIYKMPEEYFGFFTDTGGIEVGNSRFYE